MKDIVIEIEGVRHRLYNKDKVACGCQVCSLQNMCMCAEFCMVSFCEPFLSGEQYGHFIKE